MSGLGAISGVSLVTIKWRLSYLRLKRCGRPGSPKASSSRRSHEGSSIRPQCRHRIGRGRPDSPFLVKPTTYEMSAKLNSRSAVAFEQRCSPQLKQ